MYCNILSLGHVGSLSCSRWAGTSSSVKLHLWRRGVGHFVLERLVLVMLDQAVDELVA